MSVYYERLSCKKLVFYQSYLRTRVCAPRLSASSSASITRPQEENNSCPSRHKVGLFCNFSRQRAASRMPAAIFCSAHNLGAYRVLIGAVPTSVNTFDTGGLTAAYPLKESRLPNSFFHPTLPSLTGTAGRCTVGWFSIFRIRWWR